jgi:16S rRNA (cytosine1402-N4)-methyltransferase
VFYLILNNYRILRYIHYSYILPFTLFFLNNFYRFSMSTDHLPVLLHEILHAFQNCELDLFVDGTLGAGGHAQKILHAHPEIKTYLGIDQDPLARRLAAERLAAYLNQLKIVDGNFSQLEEWVKPASVQGMLLDLGVSSMQLDREEKGFSFMRDGPLDMRMNPEQDLSAAEIVNTWTEGNIAKIFRDYGEEKCWRNAARHLVRERQNLNIETTTQLVEVLKPVMPSPEAARRRKQVHPMTRIFQALRIAVNAELRVLEEVIPQAIEALAPGGRLAVITYHSLEDRIVKRLFRFAASDKEDTSGIAGVFLDKEPLIKPLSRKPIIPTVEECEENPRARSAKLRVIERL